MKIYSIIIVDANSGVPVFTYRPEGSSIQNSDRDVLFSGAMIAIQHLMKEFDGGKLQAIKTEQYDLYGETGDRFVIFVVGKINNEKVVLDFVKKLVLFIETENFPEIIVELDENLVLLLNTMIEQFNSLWQEKDISSNTLIYNERIGFQSIVEMDNSKLYKFLIGYLSTLPKQVLSINHSFILKFDEDSHVMGVLYNSDENILVQIFIICNSKLQLISSNKHEYINYAIKFLDTNELLIKSIDNDPENYNIFSRLNAVLSNQLSHTLHNYSMDIDFLGISNILNAFDKDIPKILGSLLTGIPLAVVADELDFAKPILDTFVYITGISNVDFSLTEFVPTRLTWCTENEIKSVNKIGYIIFHLSKIKVTGGKHYIYFQRIWDSIKSTLPDHRIRLFELRNICHEFWKDCDEILLESNSNGKIIDIINKKAILDERKEILHDMINWINPHLLNKSLDKKYVIKNKIHW